MRNVHAAYVGMSIFRSQPEDRLICMMVFVFSFSNSRQFVAECLELAMSTSQSFPFHRLLTLYVVYSKCIQIGTVVVVHWVGCVCNQS